MWTCSECGESIDDAFDSCWKCAAGGIETLPSGVPLPDIPLSTTPGLPASRIRRVVGIVTGEAILGANFISDWLATVTDIVGGRSGSYETKLRTARQLALYEMAREAKELGGNAVVGVNIDYETIRGSMLMVAASGTAVFAEADPGP